MTNQSTINPTQPATDADLLSSPVRSNFVAAYNDINNIYALIATISYGTIASQNANNISISGGAINGTTVGASSPSTGRFTDLTVIGTFAQPDNSVPYATIQQVSTTALLGNPAAGAANVTEIPINPTLDMGSGTLGVVNNTSTQKLISAKNGSDVGTRHKVNFIEGDNIVLTVEDDNGNDRVNVSIAAPSGGTVFSVAVSGANGIGVSGSPITSSGTVGLTLGDITPSTVNSVMLSGSSTPALAVTGASSVSGANTGDVTLTAVGSSPSANGASLSGQELTLQPADSTHPGLVTTGTQTFAGAKTFSSTITGSITGNSGTVTTNANLTGPITSSGNATAIASQTGTGTTFVMQSSPTLTTPNLGTPTTLVGTNITGTAASLTAGTATALANNTANTLAGFDNSGVYGDVAIGTGLTLSAGTLSSSASGGTVITSGTPASGNLTKFSGAAAITNGDLSGDVTTGGTLATTVAKIAGTTVSGTTGSGNVVFSTSPALTTPDLGTPSAAVLTNATGTAASLIAGTATVASTVSSANEATDTTCFPLFITASGTQSLQPKNNAALTFNSNTANLGCTTFTGALVGNADTATSASSATNATNSTNVISINEATDTTCFPLFITASGSQTLQPKNNASLTFNSNTANLGCTTFTGALAGNATTATDTAAKTGTGSTYATSTSPVLVTPTLGVASATSLATSAASPLLLTNGQLVTVALTPQTVGGATLTIPDFANVADEFTFKTKSQTMSNKTFVAPALGTPSSGSLGSCTATTQAARNNSTSLASTAYADNGDMTVPQNSQSAAYTTVLSDGGKQIYHPGADVTARTWTIDSNANVAYPIGTAITFINDTSAGIITIAITSDTLVLAGPGTTGSRTLAASGMATAIKMTSTRWMISGSGLT